MRAADEIDRLILHRFQQLTDSQKAELIEALTVYLSGQAATSSGQASNGEADS